MNWIKKDRSLVGCVIGAILTLLLFNLLPYNSGLVERFYSRGLFEGFRTIWDFTLAKLPVPLIYILVLATFYYIAKPVFAKMSIRKKCWKLLKGLVIVLSIYVMAFYWLWGFNYKRIDIRDTMGLANFEVDSTFVFNEYERVSDSLTALRQNWSEDFEWRPELLNEKELRADLISAYHFMNIDHSGRVNIRRLHPKGTLLHWSTAGVYLPWVGEGHIDAGLHPITYPFTMSHEMSHGYGWTGEDVCNFLALMACVNSSNPYHRYSGYMGYWRYLRNNAYRADREKWQETGELVSELVLEDYKAMHEYADRYPDILPRLRNLFYDNYLKSHGISKGLISYSEVIRLAHAWQEKNGSLELENQE